MQALRSLDRLGLGPSFRWDERGNESGLTGRPARVKGRA